MSEDRLDAVEIASLSLYGKEHLVFKLERKKSQTGIYNDGLFVSLASFNFVFIAKARKLLLS
jgi:hypothetical protein